MKIMKIGLHLLLVGNLFAIDVDKEISNIHNNATDLANEIYEDNKHNWYSFKAQIGLTGLKNSTLTGNNLHIKDLNANPILAINFGVNLFPDTYNINLSYTYTKDNRDTWGDEYRGDNYINQNFIDFSFIPIRTNYGNVGFAYKEHLYSLDVSRNDYDRQVAIVDMKNDGKNIDPYKNVNYLVMNGEHNGYLLATEEYKRYTLLYSLPYNIKYIPNGFGISLGYEEGTKAYEGEDFLAAKTEYDGMRYGLGIFKDQKDLNTGFSIKKLSTYMLEYEQKI